MIAILVVTSAIVSAFEVAECAGFPQTPVSAVPTPSFLPHNAISSASGPRLPYLQQLSERHYIRRDAISVICYKRFPQALTRPASSTVPCSCSESPVHPQVIVSLVLTASTGSAAADLHTWRPVGLPLPSKCHGAAGVSTLHWSGCLSGEQLLPCTVDYASVLQVACLHAAAPGLLPSGHGTFALNKPRPLGLIKGPEGSRGCLITPCAMCSARTSATPAVRSCAMGAVTAPLQHNSVRAAAAALCASMVESVRPPRMKLAGGQS